MIVSNNSSEFQHLFHPRSVAVIGATNNFSKWGFSTFSSLMNSFGGKLYPINKRDKEVLGYEAYPKITDVPGDVDLAVFVVPAEYVAEAMRDCAAKGVKAAVIISAGFAEIGPRGKALQDEVLAEARKGGIRLVGPNCMGMYSAPSNLKAFMFPLPIFPGPLALVSQGGNVGGAVAVSAVNRGVGFQYYISCGCTADIPIEDYIEYLGNDDNVKVIMTYIEGISDGRRFIDKVRKVTAKKPVVALKPGKTPAAAHAISSHSGMLSGLDAVYTAAFKEAGVIRADTVEELLDAAVGFLGQPLPKGRNVIIATPGGSYGVICADACASRGLNVIDLPQEALETFNKMFPPRWSHGNPVDPAGDRNFIMYLRAPDVILRHPEVDALIFMGFGTFSGFTAMFSSAGGSFNRVFEGIKKKLPGIEQASKHFVEMLDSKDHSKIKEIVRVAMRIMLGSIMAAGNAEVDDFVDSLSDILMTEKVLESSYMQGLRELFVSFQSGNVDGAKIANIIEMFEPMLGALSRHWIDKYGKPVISTSFTEESPRMGIAGHHPYPNAERAAAVLQKLVEYAEYRERMKDEG